MGEFHRIKVIDSKGKGKNKKYLVHYLGWPDKFNEWVSEDRMKDIHPEKDSDDNETEGSPQNDKKSDDDQNSDDDQMEGDNRNDLENVDSSNDNYEDNINEPVGINDENENDNNEEDA